MRKMWKFDESVWKWLADNWPLVSGIIVSILVTYGRIIYDGEVRRNKWAEALVCGCLTWGITAGLGRVGLTEDVAPFIGGVIGLIGVEKLREVVMHLIHRRAGINKKSNDQ